MGPKYVLNHFSTFWFLQKFLTPDRNFYLIAFKSWSQCIWSQNPNFHGYLPSPLEISGRQNWANEDKLAHCAQKATKKQQMLKNDVFWHFWRWVIFEKILTHNSKISNMALMTVEISADPKILGIINLGPKKSSNMRAPFFLSLFYDILNFMSIFNRYFWLFLTLRGTPLTP